jgi:hypothetical protein
MASAITWSPKDNNWCSQGAKDEMKIKHPSDDEECVIYAGVHAASCRWAKWHVRVRKKSCKQANRLILWGVGAPRHFLIFFFIQKTWKNMIN